MLPKNSLTFVYHQARQDYVEREILKQPLLSRPQACVLAALLFKVKFQPKILRSKENTLTPEIIKKYLDFAVPKGVLVGMPGKEWEVQICQKY